MEIIDHYAKAGSFKELHHHSLPLLLPNAWDAMSAVVFEQCGFKAIGTTSAGIAASLGYADGERINVDEMLFIIKRIAASVKVPVTADIETGYGKTVDEVKELIRILLSYGVSGINLEDGNGDRKLELEDVDYQARKIQAIKETALSCGVPLFINARTDVYWNVPNGSYVQLEETIRRASAYREAGADCIFVPGVHTANVIENLINQIQLPVNLLAGKDTPDVKELTKLGVARISSGSGPFRASLSLIRQVGEEFLHQGTYNSFTKNIISYDEMNRLFLKEE